MAMKFSLLRSSTILEKLAQTLEMDAIQVSTYSEIVNSYSYKYIYSLHIIYFALEDYVTISIYIYILFGLYAIVVRLLIKCY